MNFLNKQISRQASEMRRLVGLEGIELSQHDDMDLTTLHFAAWYNKAEQVDMLIRYGAGSFS